MASSECLRALQGGVIARVWIVMGLTRQHDPELASVFVGNGDQRFAEGQASAERSFPALQVWRSTAPVDAHC